MTIAFLCTRMMLLMLWWTYFQHEDSYTHTQICTQRYHCILPTFHKCMFLGLIWLNNDEDVKFFIQCNQPNISRNTNTNGFDDKTWSGKGWIMASSFLSVANTNINTNTSITTNINGFYDKAGSSLGRIMACSFLSVSNTNRNTDTSMNTNATIFDDKTWSRKG